MSVQYTTPFSQLLDDGTYEIRFPQQVLVGSNIYNFSSWSDGAAIVVDSGTSEVVRTLIQSANRSLGATYTVAPPITYTLRITSSPITGIQVTVGGDAYTTSQTLTLAQGSYGLAAPASVTSGSSVYNFLSWEDGSTNPSRTINLASNMTVTCTYQLQAPVTYTLAISSSPAGVPLTVNGYQYYTPTGSLTLTSGSHSIVAPSNVLVGTTIYNFVSWNDGSTSPQKTISLTSNMTLTFTMQVYTPPPDQGSLEIHAFLDEVEIITLYEVVGVDTGSTPATPFAINVGNYVVKVTYGLNIMQKEAVITVGSAIRLDFQFSSVTPRRSYLPYIGAAGLTLGAVIIAAASGGKKKK